MSRKQKLLDQILSGRHDQTIRFDALCGLLATLGFAVRIRGSHHIFTRDGMVEILNLQTRPDGTAKPYQVKQVRDVLVAYQIGLSE